jgi:positive regulator of sigma E activity
MSSFSTYMIGFVVLILGLALAAYLLNAPAVWIVVGVVILVGFAILMATTRTKPKDPQAPPDAP